MSPTTEVPGAWQQMVIGHQTLINQNPIALTFVRRERERDGTHFTALPTEELGTFVVRVHQQGRGSAQISDRMTGWQERDPTWGCIMPAEVPLRVTDGEDGDVRVEVIHPIHGFFRLRRVRPLEFNGRLFGWQSDLERLSGRWEMQEPEPPPAPGRPPLEDDPDWVETMQAIDAYIAEHPGLSPRLALRSLGRDVPPERTLQAWRQRWKSLPTAQQTQETPETVFSAPESAQP